MSRPISLTALNEALRADFVDLLGGIFEHSAWVADQVIGQRPFDSVDALHSAMTAQVQAAEPAAQLALIRAHPELAGKAAIRRELTGESTREQAGAGLDQCSPDEYRRLAELNQAYKKKFGFPFILAVRGYDRAGIIEQFRRRLALTLEQERAESLNQIYRIAHFRLRDLIRP